MMERIKLARAVMREAFKEDPDFKRTYIDNVAMVLYDRLDINIREDRDDVAETIVDLVFGSNERGEDYDYGEEIQNNMRGFSPEALEARDGTS